MAEIHESIDLIYEQVETQLTELLKLRRFKILEQVFQPEVFGSRYTIWSNNQAEKALRFKWDGKESWFVLEESPVAENLEIWQWPWADILLLQIDKTNLSKEKINSIVNQLVNGLK